MSLPIGKTEMADLLELLTHNGKEGTGYFDVVMRSMSSQLETERESGRISPSEYSTIYTELVSVALNGSITYLLQAPEAMHKAKLMEAQVAIANKELELKDKELEIREQELINAQKQNELLDAQKDKLIAETENIRQNTANAVEQGNALVHITRGEDFKADALEYRAQAEYAVTHDTLPDGTPVLGSIGKDNKLKTAQTVAFKSKDLYQMISGLQSSNTAQVTTLGDVSIAPNVTTGAKIDAYVIEYFKQLGVTIP